MVNDWELRELEEHSQFLEETARRTEWLDDIDLVHERGIAALGLDGPFVCSKCGRIDQRAAGWDVVKDQANEVLFRCLSCK